MKEKEIKKVQEETREQILTMIDGWTKNAWEGIKGAKTEQSKVWANAQFDAFSKIYLAVKFLKIK